MLPQRGPLAYVAGNFTKVASTPVTTDGMRVKQSFAAYPPAT
jgi:hypothetical protein